MTSTVKSQITEGGRQQAVENQTAYRVLHSAFQKKGGEQMGLMRAFGKVDDEGKISIPGNIRREVGLREGQMVEIKVSGPNKAQFIVIHKRQNAR